MNKTNKDSSKKKLLIFGTGTLAEVAFYYFHHDSPFELLGFVDMPEFANSLSEKCGLPVYDWESAQKQFDPKDVSFFVAVGYRQTNSVRQQRYEQVKSAGYHCANYLSSKAMIFTDKIGENCFILENNVIQPFTEIGNNVTLWSGNHIGHHSVIEDHVFIASHVVISGKCRIGNNTFMGVNACTHDGITIGEKTVVGAGAIISSSCPARSLFVPTKMVPKIVDRDLL